MGVRGHVRSTSEGWASTRGRNTVAGARSPRKWGAALDGSRGSVHTRGLSPKRERRAQVARLPSHETPSTTPSIEPTNRARRLLTHKSAAPTLIAVPNDLGVTCSCCGQCHEGLPFSYGTDAPAYWTVDLANQPSSLLAGEQCVIEGQHFFIRGRIVLPVIDADEDFEWGVWVSLSRDSYTRICDLWTSPERTAEAPYFGWLSTDLPVYQPTTLNLKANVHPQPVGIRPTIELEPTDHPLAVEQHSGITLARVQAIAEGLLHPDGPASI